MKGVADAQLLARLTGEQAGVFSKADLQTALAEPHPAAFRRRIQMLQDNGILRRFTRGFYVTETFDLPTLSQRIAPDSCISFGTVLARELLIGTSPARRIVATKVGPARTYRALDFEIEHVGISPRLFFGHTYANGVRFANAEKAVLDVLYFHLRGRRYPFDIYSDINFQKLDTKRVREYLRRYQNPKFVAFAKGVQGLR
jgi:predicted transcriptional regulator of viral defense system